MKRQLVQHQFWTVLRTPPPRPKLWDAPFNGVAQRKKVI